MVYSSIDPARQSYRLWHRFSMPTTRGNVDAVAVRARVGQELNSAYTFLLDHIVILVWGLVVYFGIFASIRRYGKKHPESSIARELYAGRHDPFEILKLTAQRCLKPGHSRLLILFWLMLSLGFLVMKYAIPIVFSSHIIIGNAAPVASEAIYVPSFQDLNLDVDNPRQLLSFYALDVPAALRALGSIEGVNSTDGGNSSISVGQPEILATESGSGDPNQRINYSYSITGLDFGLQHYPDLTLNVEGSCITRYSWYVDTNTSIGGTTRTVTDEYNLYNNQTPITQYVSSTDGLSPVAQFFTGVVPAVGPPSNFTWCALISSVARLSYETSIDPWYLTVNNSGDRNDPPYRVKEGRPALSCWQNDVWSYRGANSSILGLNSSALPGLDLSVALSGVFNHYLSTPKLPNLATRLGVSALKSASTSLNRIFNASSSSLHTELERLVFASYIATVNTLVETTLYPSTQDISIPNGVRTNGNIQDGVDGFVIYSQDVTTLSVKALIVIPVLTVVLWIIAIAVILVPFAEMKALSRAEAATQDSSKNTGEPGGETQPTTAEKIINETMEKFS